RWAYIGAWPLEAARLDEPELFAHRAFEKADRTLPAVRSVDAAKTLVDGRSPSPRDLHRSRVEVARLRMPRRRGVLLDEDAAHAEARQLERRSQAHGAAAENDHSAIRLEDRHPQVSSIDDSRGPQLRRPFRSR